jgi:hypothetical protein
MEAAAIIAAGLGSFGGYGTLFWLLEQAKKKLLLVDKSEYEAVKKTLHKK